MGVSLKGKFAGVAIGETIRLALDTLRAHKLRSFLTLLGVILAVTTLIAVMSVIDGLNLYVSDKLANMGANAFLVDRFGIITNFQEFIKAQKRPPLRVEDLEFLRQNMRLANQVAAVTGMRLDARSGNELFEDARLTGVTWNYNEIRTLNLAEGRFLTEADDLHRSPVCFIGADIAQKFFPNTDPIGRNIRVQSQVFEVVGVAQALGTMLGQSQDDFIFIPLTTFQKSWSTRDSSITLYIQARDGEVMDAAQDEARMLLRAKRHDRYNDADSFGIISTSSITSLWQQLTQNLAFLAVSITSVFLVVGGIVIMNIMLASVVERTREIGIRKAIGARRRHIVLQFLAESAMLAATGGALGVVIAYSGVQLVYIILEFPLHVPMTAVIISLTLSTFVGLFFGIYPAVRASRLDPIEALRQEV